MKQVIKITEEERENVNLSKLRQGTGSGYKIL